MVFASTRNYLREYRCDQAFAANGCLGACPSSSALAIRKPSNGPVRCHQSLSFDPLISLKKLVNLPMVQPQFLPFYVDLIFFNFLRLGWVKYSRRHRR